MKQRYYVIFFDCITRQSEGLGLASRDAAEKGKHRFKVMYSAQKQVSDGRYQNGDSDHDADRKAPLAQLGKNFACEICTNQHTKTQNDRNMKPPRHTQIIADCLKKTAKNPDTKETANQEWRGHAQL